MKIEKAFLRKVISVSSFRQTIRRKLKNLNLGQYINIQTKFYLNGSGDISQFIGQKYILDIHNREDIEFYEEYLINEFNTKYILENQQNKITCIAFICLKSSKEEYISFINKLNHDK